MTRIQGPDGLEVLVGTTTVGGREPDAGMSWLTITVAKAGHDVATINLRHDINECQIDILGRTSKDGWLPVSLRIPLEIAHHVLDQDDSASLVA